MINLSIIELISILTEIKFFGQLVGKFASITYRSEAKFRKRNGLTEPQKNELFGGELWKETKISFRLGRCHKQAIRRACKLQGIEYTEKQTDVSRETWLTKYKGLLLAHKENGQIYLPIVGQKNGIIYSRYVDANGKIWDKSQVEGYLLASQSYSDPYQTETLGLKSPIPFYLIKIENIKTISIFGNRYEIK